MIKHRKELKKILSTSKADILANGNTVGKLGNFTGNFTVLDNQQPAEDAVFVISP